MIPTPIPGADKAFSMSTPSPRVKRSTARNTKTGKRRWKSGALAPRKTRISRGFSPCGCHNVDHITNREQVVDAPFLPRLHSARAHDSDQHHHDPHGRGSSGLQPVDRSGARIGSSIQSLNNPLGYFAIHARQTKGSAV